MPMRYLHSRQVKHDRKLEYYDKHPRLAFVESFSQKVRVKRHRSMKYDRYHYYLPSNLSPVLQFLKKYFRLLDDEFANVEQKDRYRHSEFEYPDLAIEMMILVRSKITKGVPIVAGSQAISPVPWAVFGPNVDNRLCRCHFKTLQDVFVHYGDYISHRGFNVVNVARPHNLNPELDKWIVLADLYNHSINFVLACALLMLFDLVRYCGPDCYPFHPVFSNDKRRRLDIDLLPWDRARRAVVPFDKPDFGELWLKQYGNHSITSVRPHGPYKHCVAGYGKSYFDVEIKEVVVKSHADLADGEKVELFETAKKKPPYKGFSYVPHADLDDLTREDFEEDLMVTELNKEYQRIMADHGNDGLTDVNILNQPKHCNRSEITEDLAEARAAARGWSGFYESSD